jgi:hypothetical protein
MKKINLILLLFSTLFFTSCEESVDVDLDTERPKIVIEAAIYWYKETKGNEQKIKLTTTTGFYNDDEIPVVSDAIIYIRNRANKRFNFIEIRSTGEYVCTDFEPVIDETYTLTIIHNGKVYSATETLKSIVPITKITQKDNGGLTQDKIEVRAYFNDPPNELNHYFYTYNYSNQVAASFSAEEDRFFQGNEFFSVSNNDDLKPGDEIVINHFGISEDYYNYMIILASIAGDGGRIPFQSPLATIRGNIINENDKNNFPLGYFSLSEAVTQKYTVK